MISNKIITGIADSKGNFKGRDYDKVRIYFSNGEIPTDFGSGLRCDSVSVSRRVWDESCKAASLDPSKASYKDLMGAIVDFDFNQYQSIKAVKFAF